MQAGGCPCFIEPELAPAALVARMQAVGVQYLIHDSSTELPPKANIRLRELPALAAYGSVLQLPASEVDDNAMMLFTSGSTGLPKGVLLSQGNLACNARGVLLHTGTSAKDKLLHVMPIYYTNGINNQLIVPLLAGATIVLVPRFRAEDTLSWLQTGGITYMTGVPTMYSRMLPLVTADMNFSRLRFLRCGSAPITSALHQQIEEAFGVPLVVSYGLSEATCTSTMNPPEHRRIGSIGTVLDGQNVRLFQSGTDIEATVGEEGEIRIGGHL